MSNFMGVNPDGSIAWVESFKVPGFVGDVLPAPINAKAGMVWNGVVASEPAKTRDQIDVVRKSAYQQRSDPLYMQWQYDQTPEAEQLWRAEVAAIKQEYPWPV